MADNLPELGATGLVINLYEYLWTKNNLLQTRCMYHKCPPVLVPDTILLRNKQPVSWYFSSFKTGSIQRRTKDLTIGKVVEAVIRRQDPTTDVASVYVGAAQGDVQPITEYLSPAGMDYFLSTPPSRRTKAGLLQTFVLPKGTSNFIIRVNWTPDVCSLDSCININKLADPELDVQDRAATNDDKNCVLIPMSGNVLATQLERLCGCIAEHVHLASSQQFKVMSMIINFKIDSEDRVWLLWCEQLEVGDDAGRLIQGSKADARLLGDVSDAEEDMSTEHPRKQHKEGKDRSRRDSRGPRTPTRKSSSGRRKSSKYAEPEVVDSDEEDEGGSERGGRRPRSGDDEEDEDEGLPRIRPSTRGSEGDMDGILLPEGSGKPRRTKSSGRRTADSTPRSDASSALDEAPRKQDRKAAERQRELRRTMGEEKRRREEAEKKAAEAEERLKKAEAKAKAAEARLKNAQQAARAAAAPPADAGAEGKKAGTPVARTKRTVPDGSLPRISKPAAPGGSRPSTSASGAPQQDPLISVDAEVDAEMAEGANVMAEEA
eukprot:CAMPEP_0114131620 /NCGR_PEP_ID=MMETSP0043_2-20121206/12653_1 /TAXON_ID=464988 /ORGANISM="Hemiselmis andersenii, Strain CCMP644" /LENGTH=545 /DNA_ID=CAMNT_0001225069 /DNA_START=151 /DNA_END=1784 /DNA_ORIENTATION=-